MGNLRLFAISENDKFWSFFFCMLYKWWFKFVSKLLTASHHDLKIHKYTKIRKLTQRLVRFCCVFITLHSFKFYSSNHQSFWQATFLAWQCSLHTLQTWNMLSGAEHWHRCWHGTCRAVQNIDTDADMACAERSRTLHKYPEHCIDTDMEYAEWCRTLHRYWHGICWVVQNTA